MREKGGGNDKSLIDPFQVMHHGSAAREYGRSFQVVPGIFGEKHLSIKFTVSHRPQPTTAATGVSIKPCGVVDSKTDEKSVNPSAKSHGL
jgi:hypothetical protein